MKHIPKNLEGDENVSNTHPLKELTLYLVAIFAVIFVTYQLLGYSVHIFTDRLDHSSVMNIHRYIGSKVDLSNSKILNKKSDKLRVQEERLNNLFQKVLSHTDFANESFNISVIKGKSENALAYPGGNIVIVQSLLDNVKSENELAFVIAHEIGHFEHRHLLKNLGRSLITVGFSILLSGVESSISDKMISFLNISNLSFSREQEIESDEFALSVLNKMYKHVNGSHEFFNRSKKEESAFSTTYFSTHPLAEDRVQRLIEYSKLHNYSQNGVLSPWIP